MAISAAKLVVEIGADIGKLTKGLSDSDTALGRFGAKAMTTGALMSAAITTPAIFASRAVFEIGAALEQSKVAFTTMLGSAQKAGKYLDELQQFAAHTPFEFAELQDAARRMMAFGFEAKRVIPMLTDIGDAAAGLGLGADGVNRITLALGQMQAKSRVSAQEMMQLTEAGIPAWRYLAEAMGKTTSQVMKLSEQGLIPAGDAIQYILAGMREDFGGLMAEQAKTANGQISNLKDELYALGGSLAEFVLPTMKEFVGDARDLVAAFNELPDGAKKAVVGFGAMALAAGPVTSVIGTLVRITPGLVAFGQEFAAALTLLKGADLAGTFAVATAGAGGLAAALLPVAMAVGSIVGVWAAWNENIEKTNRRGQEAVQSAWEDFFTRQVADGKSATEILEAYRAAQERVRQSVEMQWQFKNGAWQLEFGEFAKLFIKNKDQLINGSADLGLAIGRTATSYTEYVGVMRQAGLETGDQAALGALLAQGYQAMSQMVQTASANVLELGQNGEAAMQQLAESSSQALNELEQLSRQQSAIKDDMTQWMTQTGSLVQQELGGRFVDSSDRYRDALRSVDEVMGTSYLQQLLLKDSVKDLVNEYARTGDLSAFQSGLQAIKEEGLAGMSSELETATQKAQELYDKLLRLPKEIQIEVGFKVADFPEFTGSGGAGSGKTANNQIKEYVPQAGGGDWLVTKPTLFLAGEAGPERATFTPMKGGRQQENNPQVIVQATVSSQIDVARLAQDVAMEIRRRRL